MMSIIKIYLLFVVVGTIAAAATPLAQVANVETNARKQNLFEVFRANKISGQEAVTRLILAETMASHCEPIEMGQRAVIESVMLGIARVIHNRLPDSRDESKLKVVFAKDQFNSSVAEYRCSEIAGFLDPRQFENRVRGLNASQLWKMAEAADRAAESEEVFTQDAKRVKNYYLPQHFRRGDCRFKAPPWVQIKNEAVLRGNVPLSETIQHCIGFYILH